MRQSRDTRIVGGSLRMVWRALTPRHTKHKRIKSNIQGAHTTAVHKINYSFSIQFLFTYSTVICIVQSVSQVSQPVVVFFCFLFAFVSLCVAYLSKTIQAIFPRKGFQIDNEFYFNRWKNSDKEMLSIVRPSSSMRLKMKWNEHKHAKNVDRWKVTTLCLEFHFFFVILCSCSLSSHCHGTKISISPAYRGKTVRICVQNSRLVPVYSKAHFYSECCKQELRKQWAFRTECVMRMVKIQLNWNDFDCCAIPNMCACRRVNICVLRINRCIYCWCCCRCQCRWWKSFRSTNIYHHHFRCVFDITILPFRILLKNVFGDLSQTGSKWE